MPAFRCVVIAVPTFCALLILFQYALFRWTVCDALAMIGITILFTLYRYFRQVIYMRYYLERRLAFDCLFLRYCC